MKFIRVKQAKESGLLCPCFVSEKLLQDIKKYNNDDTAAIDWALYDCFIMLLYAIGDLPPNLPSLKTIVYSFKINGKNINKISMVGESYPLTAHLIKTRNKKTGVLVTGMNDKSIPLKYIPIRKIKWTSLVDQDKLITLMNLSEKGKRLTEGAVSESEPKTIAVEPKFKTGKIGMTNEIYELSGFQKFRDFAIESLKRFAENKDFGTVDGGDVQAQLKHIDNNTTDAMILGEYPLPESLYNDLKAVESNFSMSVLDSKIWIITYLNNYTTILFPSQR